MQPTTKKRLSKRPKIEDQPKADDSFVNVFIELYAERSDVPQAQQAEARNTLDELLDRAVGAAKSASLAGAKLPRRTFISATVPVSLLDELEQHPAVSFVHPADPLKLDAPPVGHATPGGEQGDRRRGDIRPWQWRAHRHHRRRRIRFRTPGLSR